MATTFFDPSLAPVEKTIWTEVFNLVTDGVKTPLEEYWQYRMYKALFIYGSPIIFLLGLFGNIFAFVVLQTRSMRSSGASFLLSALAVSDLGCLLTELVNNWVKEITSFKVNIRGHNIHTCRLHIFLTFLFHHLTPMTLVFLTVQRVICVYLPLKAKVICSRGNIIKVWTAIAILYVSFNSIAFFLVSYDTRVATLNMNCFFNDDVIDWFNTTDSVLESYMPCTVIIIGNILIVVKVRNARMKRLSSQMSPTASSSNKQAKGDASDSMTTMLIVVTTTFVLLTTPFYVWVNGVHMWSAFGDDQLMRAQTHFAYAITYHLLEFNFSINFILYCMFGKRFRSAVRSMTGCGNRAQQPMMFNATAATASTRMSSVQSGSEGMLSVTSPG